VQQLTFNADGTVSTDTNTLVFNFNFVDSHLTYGLNGHTYLAGPDNVAHDVTGATRSTPIHDRARRRKACVRQRRVMPQPNVVARPHTRPIYARCRQSSCG
jgi:hypothetical protein